MLRRMSTAGAPAPALEALTAHRSAVGAIAMIVVALAVDHIKPQDLVIMVDQLVVQVAVLVKMVRLADQVQVAMLIRVELI